MKEEEVQQEASDNQMQAALKAMRRVFDAHEGIPEYEDPKMRAASQAMSDTITRLCSESRGRIYLPRTLDELQPNTLLGPVRDSEKEGS